MNVVSFGGGTNSTALIIGMYEKEIPIDLILFADTGAEMPHTYEHIELMNKWLIRHGLPQINVVENVDKDGNRLTLEEECLRSKTLPSIAYGFKKCSLKHKVGPQDKFCNNYQGCIDVWSGGQKVVKFIGYDAGEERRKTNAFAHDIQDTKYKKDYALINWGWYREDCIEKIVQHGLPKPGKSSCFFCPSMKKHEIKELHRKHPDLLKRAIDIEQNAKENLITVKGLGRDYSWEKFIEGVESQIGMCFLYEDDNVPCGCYDG
jgi:hypothetical protein